MGAGLDQKAGNRLAFSELSTQPDGKGKKTANLV